MFLKYYTHILFDLTPFFYADAWKTKVLSTYSYSRECIFMWTNILLLIM